MHVAIPERDCHLTDNVCIIKQKDPKIPIISTVRKYNVTLVSQKIPSTWDHMNLYAPR